MKKRESSASRFLKTTARVMLALYVIVGGLASAVLIAASLRDAGGPHLMVQLAVVGAIALSCVPWALLLVLCEIADDVRASRIDERERMETMIRGKEVQAPPRVRTMHG